MIEHTSARSSAATAAVLAPGSSSCRLCGGKLRVTSIRPRSEHVSAGRYRIDICDSCGAGTTMPRPNQDEIDAGTYDYGVHTLIEVEKRYRSTRLIRRAGVPSGRVLDVGCTFGFLLDEARRVGLETWGVEPARGPARVAAARGHRVTEGTLDDHVAKHPDVRFDAIFVQHVLEHLPNPADLIRTMRGLLVPGGRAILVVPNFAARLRRLAPDAWGWNRVPAHLHHFTATALRRLVEAAGLTVENESTFGGDSLFCALTALHGVGLASSTGVAVTNSRVTRLALGALGRLLRPYYYLGDDEFVLIARSD